MRIQDIKIMNDYMKAIYAEEIAFFIACLPAISLEQDKYNS